MEFFSSDGVKIAYAVEGNGNPILLIHGFASNMQTNWGAPGWIKLLTRNGFQVIAFDNRGHGASEKLYDPEAYTGPIMAEDARRLLDHLGIERADVLGYSMGARIAAFLGLQHPERVRSAVFAGLGANMVYGLGDPKPIAAALLTEDPSTIADPNALAFRIFADQTIPGHEIATFSRPVLVAVGTEDAVAGSAKQLADAIPGAQALDIPGRDHMKAVGDRVFKEGVLSFLERRP